MDISNMKNIIILKNLPSNLIEEAIVILKQNKKVKKPELIENKKQKFSNEEHMKDNKQNFIINEAQSVIADYISKVEEQDKSSKRQLNELKQKYKKLKVVSVTLGILMLICFVINLF